MRYAVRDSNRIASNGGITDTPFLTVTPLPTFYTLMQGIDGTIYHLRMMGSVWEIYSH